MNRQSLIIILIGAIATFSGLATTDLLRSRRCTELEGMWTATTRECVLQSGHSAGTWSAGIVLAGILIAGAVGFMLYRGYQFATGRARGLASRQGT
jgi:hypothetical protein